jgi:hypothetical protein
MTSRDCCDCCKKPKRDCSCGGGGKGGNGGNGGHGGDGGGGDGPPWKPDPQGSWLLIRYDAADYGVRPIPSADCWWESPDIWVEGGDPYGNPIGGKPCRVHARVWNLGFMDAIPTAVSFSFIEPSLGIPATAPKLIGVAPAHVRGLRFVDVSVPWTPPEAQGNMHACLIVTCSCPAVNDAPSVPGSAVADRHTGQHNTTIVDATMEAMTFQLNFANLAPRTAEVRLAARGTFRTVRDLKQFDPLGAPALATAARLIDRPADATALRLMARRAGVISDLDEGRHFTQAPERAITDHVKVNGIQRGRVHRSGALVPVPGRLNTLDHPLTELAKPVELKSLQHATAELTVTLPKGGPERDWFILRIAQLTDGAVDGGYTVVFRLNAGQAGGQGAAGRQARTA